MSPLYEYRCTDGHVHERLRRYDERDEPATCLDCGGDTERIVSAHHQAVDGIYSYAENIGSEESFERKRDAIKEGQRLIKRGTA